MLTCRHMRTRHLFAAFLTLLLFACNGRAAQDQTAKKSSKPSPSPAPVHCPLTGVETSRSTDIARPPLAVKIENSVAARPQAGLEAADIVYEELAEGGITRFLVIFHCSDASSVGPVRSARLVDPDILQAFSPVLFGYSGANPIVDSKVRSTKGLTVISDDGKAFHRERGRSAPHNLFTSTTILRTYFKGSSTPPKTGFVFDPSALFDPECFHPTKKGSSPSKGSPSAKASPSPFPCPTPTKLTATKTQTSPTVSSTVEAPPPGQSVTFEFSGTQNRVKYVFDAGSKVYQRFHGDKAHLAANGKQLTATNVVICKVKVTEGQIKDAAGNSSPEIAVIGSGEATILRGGVATTAKWSKSSASQHMTFTDSMGRPVRLLPGNTWVHLVPINEPVTVS